MMPPSMTVGERFVVAIKASAREVCDIDGDSPVDPETVTFEDEADAVAFASSLSCDDARVRIQTAAPQDPSAVDAYLVADRQENEWEPTEVDGSVATFPVGGNIYGELAVALLNLGTAVSPALKHYFSTVVPEGERGHVRSVTEEPWLPDVVPDSVSWRPDLRIDVDSRDESEERREYYAEVKSGNSSFERNQRTGMMRAAVSVRVLKIRVFLTELPAEYSVKIHAVGPDRWPEGAPSEEDR